MTRRRTNNTDFLFAPVRRLEHFKRCRDHMLTLRALLVARGAGKKELATLDGTIAEMSDVVAMSEIFPPDTPLPESDEPRPAQPLCPPGEEVWMSQFFMDALEDQP
jgi:hypothetical protein